MKSNRIILIISMVIISLLAVGAVSASENVSDVFETSDFDDAVTVENNFDNVETVENDFEDTVTVENDFENVSTVETDIEDPITVENDLQNSDILSMENEIEPDVIAVDEEYDSSSLGDIDLSNLFGENSTFDISGALNGLLNGTGINLSGFKSNAFSGYAGKNEYSNKGH